MRCVEEKEGEGVGEDLPEGKRGFVDIVGNPNPEWMDQGVPKKGVVCFGCILPITGPVCFGGAT